MRLYATAESVEIEQDERGFDLRVTTEDGDDFLFNIQNVAAQLVESRGFKDLVLWLAEGKHQAALHQAHLSILDSEGYSVTDPKHPDWHSVHSDIWDNRAGK